MSSAVSLLSHTWTLSSLVFSYSEVQIDADRDMSSSAGLLEQRERTMPLDLATYCGSQGTVNPDSGPEDRAYWKQYFEHEDLSR
jgi:hypothetical protein